MILSLGKEVLQIFNTIVNTFEAFKTYIGVKKWKANYTICYWLHFHF